MLQTHDGLSSLSKLECEEIIVCECARQNYESIHIHYELLSLTKIIEGFHNVGNAWTMLQLIS